MAEIYGVDRFRKSPNHYTMLFNIMNGESVQVNYFLKPTGFSNFHLNSTIIAYMSLNSSTDISLLKEKMFPKFPFKNLIPDEVLHFK